MLVYVCEKKCEIHLLLTAALTEEMERVWRPSITPFERELREGGQSSAWDMSGKMLAFEFIMADMC